MIGFLIISGSGVDSIGGPFYVFFTLSGKGWAGSGVRVMGGIKNKNFSFRAVVFSKNVLFLIMATLLLMLVDGGIVNSANAACSSMDCVTGTPRTQPQPTKTEAISNATGTATGTIDTLTGSVATATNSNLLYFIVSLVIQTEYASNGNANLSQQQIKELYNVGISPQQMYDLTVTAGYADSSSFFAASCAVFWCSFAPPPPTQTQQASTTQQTSVQQDISSTGNSATQTPLPQSVCNMMINGQCNPNTVTAVTAVVATAVIGGITAGVVSAVNNQAQQQQQQQQNNDLMTILAIQNSNKGPRVCYDSAQPPNVIPCP